MICKIYIFYILSNKMSLVKIEKNKLTEQLTNIDKQVDSNDDNLFVMSPHTFLICGRTGTGKSTIMLTIISKPSSPFYQFFHHIFLVSPTAPGDAKFKKLVKELDEEGKYFDDLTTETLQTIKNRADENVDKWEARGKKKTTLNQLLIIDDCAHKLKNKDNKLLEDIVLKSRHARIWVFVLTQKYNAVPLIIRNQMSCLILFHVENQKELEAIIKEVGSNEKMFLKALEFATADPFSFLYVKLNPRPVFHRGFDRLVFKNNEEEKE
jgi:hypothetical protein